MRMRTPTFVILCTLLVACASSSPQSCPSGTCEIAVVCLGTSTTSAAALGSTLSGGTGGAGGAGGASAAPGTLGMSEMFIGCPF